VAWVRDRGEHYLLGPLLLASNNVLAVGSLLFISLLFILVQILFPYQLQFRFPSVFSGLASLQASEVRFSLSGFLSLDSLRAVPA
jgi:hypothetical protein